MHGRSQTSSHAFNQTMYVEVYVPYCTSDSHAGRKEADGASGGYFFHGKYVVEAVLDDLLDNVLDTSFAGQFVFMGMSAGAFGVGKTCDDVAVRVKESNPAMDVRCVMDGLDFSPPWLHVPGCDPYVFRSMTAKFWQADLDKSCVEHYGADAKECLLFASYHPFIETPFMLVVPYQDTNMGIHPCSPALDQEPDFWTTWREAIQEMALDLVEVSIGSTEVTPDCQVHPSGGLFLSNCPHHVSHNKPPVWGDLEVEVLDQFQGQVTYKQALANWLGDTRPFQALDDPEARNPGCPFINT